MAGCLEVTGICSSTLEVTAGSVAVGCQDKFVGTVVSTMEVAVCSSVLGVEVGAPTLVGVEEAVSASEVEVAYTAPDVAVSWATTVFMSLENVNVG